jgi:hypothetical protein
MITFTLEATVGCEYEYESPYSGKCNCTETISESAESTTISCFMNTCRDVFETRGWNFYGRTLCPKHAKLHNVKKRESI